MQRPIFSPYSSNRLHGISSETFGLGCEKTDAFAVPLSRGALHDVYAIEGRHAVTASAFALASSLRSTAAQMIVWVRQRFVTYEAGGLYGPGLCDLGLDPERLVLVEARDALGALRAGADAASYKGVGAVLIEVWGEPRILDLTATRRLMLAARASGVTLFLIRFVAKPAPSAAETRWRVEPAPSMPLLANAPGDPVFSLTLLRHRLGRTGGPWLVRWSRDDLSFHDAAPLSGSLVSLPFDQPPASHIIPMQRTG